MKKCFALSVSLTLFVLMVAPTVFAGGQQQSSGSSSGPVTVKLWDIRTQQDQKMMVDATNKFNQAHPNIKVVPEWFQNNPYKNKLRIALGAGNGPDIFYNWGGGPLRSYVEANDVVNLSPYLNADPSWKNRYANSVWGPATVGGKIYGVPTEGMDAELLFYNKALLSKYNLPVPTTWAKLMQDVKTLHANGIIPIGLAGKSEWPEMIWVQYLTDRIGGPAVFNAIAKGEKNAWSNPAIIKALQLCQDLVKAHAFEPGYASVNASTNQAEALVAGNKAAMVAQGDWVYGTFKNNFASFYNKGALGYTAIPKVGNNPYGDQAVGAPSGYYSISSTSKAVKAAIEYLKQVNLNNSIVHTMLTVTGRVPPVKGIAPQLKAMKNGQFEVWLYNTITKAPEVQLYWDQYLSPTVAKQMLTNISEVFLLQETPQQFAQNMNKTLS